MEKKASHRAPTVPTAEQILEKSTSGATFLMIGQLFTKMISFVLNSVLVRFLSPRIFGITAFLEFIVGTVLFFSREAIRLSTLRIRDRDDEDDGVGDSSKGRSRVYQTAVNFGHIPLWIGFPLSIVLIAWQYRNINEYFTNLPYFTLSIFLIWMSIVFELLSEPLFIVNQFMLNYATRSQFESAAVTIGCFVNCGVILSFEKLTSSSVRTEASREGTAILAFALGKLAHSMALLACYYLHYLRNFKPKNLFRLRLTRIYAANARKGYFFQHDISEHFKKVYFQLCFKHLLTEGDKLIINSLCTVEEQGIYSLLSNYGSLITRLVFSQIEESLRLLLARLLANERAKNLKLSMDVLLNITRFYAYLSLLILIFGPVNSPFLLQFLIGSKWSTTSVLDTIRIYCFYLPFLAMNGVFEAFFQSTATGDQILKHSYFMMVFSGVFLVNCWLLIEYFGLSINGLIISNIINMALRLGYCTHFVNMFYKNLSTESSRSFYSLRNVKGITLLSIAVWIVDWWVIGSVRNFHQLFLNVALALLLLSVILFMERESLRTLIGKSRISSSKNV
ncbi:hypothetical protein HG536_0D02430 [Torulaspora globosa]|uniref:Man(5)GlcNAc(2)-PP-dolichol translocation protein RFT1 n=1 Tax=Torulaspora globosa TaxID=48254 RepID=A0A7G3ZGT5_9SACH|nr:uncharacterized protein HG536_0D02430 [Torulaspora globosa]QLL32721.1 hypothetical protein HG536_0D02430 [Torulaspora globosa]